MPQPYCYRPARAARSGAVRVFGGFPVVPRPAGHHFGRRDLEPDRRGRRPAGIALPGRSPRRDGYGAFWNAREPRQRTWVDRRELWEAPVEDGGHIAGRAEVSSAGGCQHVAEWVLSGFSCQREQVDSQGWPCRFGRESRDVVVGLVELCDGLWSEELLGCDVDAVCVALDRLEEPGRWVVELAQHGAADTGVSSRARICCRVSVGVRGAMVSGRMMLWGSPSPTTWR